MFRSAVSTFRSGERAFRSGERTFRSAEHKPNTVQRYIKTRYYANIYPTIFIHLQRVRGGSEKWECHIESDWLLVWIQENDTMTLLFIDTGTHSDIF